MARWSGGGVPPPSCHDRHIATPTGLADPTSRCRSVIPRRLVVLSPPRVALVPLFVPSPLNAPLVLAPSRRTIAAPPSPGDGLVVPSSLNCPLASSPPLAARSPPPRRLALAFAAAGYEVSLEHLQTFILERPPSSPKRSPSAKRRSLASAVRGGLVPSSSPRHGSAVAARRSAPASARAHRREAANVLTTAAAVLSKVHSGMTHRVRSVVEQLRITVGRRARERSTTRGPRRRLASARPSRRSPPSAVCRR